MKEIKKEVVENVCEEVTNTKRGLAVKIAAAVVSVAAGVGAVLFYKKKQSNKLETKEENN